MKSDFFSIAGIALVFLVLVGLAACEDAAGPEPIAGGGTVCIEPMPFSLDAPWMLTGPGGSLAEGNGYFEADFLAQGEYTVTWQEVPDRQTPMAQACEVITGQTQTLSAYYPSEPPDQTTALMVDARGLANHPGSSVLLSVDLRTGLADSLAVLDHPEGVRCLVRGPDGYLWAVAIVTQELLRIDPESYVITSVGVMGNWNNQRVVSLAFSSAGQLFGYDERRYCIVTIDRASARATPLTPGALSWVGGIAFGPDGVLYACTYHGVATLITIDPETGLADSLVGQLRYRNGSGTVTINTLVFSSRGILLGVSSGDGIGSNPVRVDENLVEIDPASGRVWAIGGVGSLGSAGFRTPSGLALVQ